jgi:hypothetical protein
MNTSVVYWCSDAPGRTPELLSLFNSVVNKRHKDTESPDLYYRCRSAQEIFKNTFILPATEDIHVLLPHGKLVQSRDSIKFHTRLPVFGNNPAIDYNPQWLFFSEDDISIQLTPPYFHKTKASEYATVLSGEFNISKWFRPVNATFSLWEDSKELFISSEDPLAYVTFLTENKVILKEFKQTDKINRIVLECVTLKEKFPNLPLSENYNKFMLNRKHKEVLEEIKTNLV